MIYTNEVTASIVVIGANSAEVLNTSYGILSFNLKDFALFKTKPIRRGPMNIELGGKGIENMDAVFDINKTITALDILQTSNYSVLYFGSKDGQLCIVCTKIVINYYVYLQLGGKRENFTTKIVSVANTKIIYIKVEKDSVYYITEKKIGKIDINDCLIHTDCESRMNSFNSSCGRDYDENRCIRIV
ncbi:unnamed protein product [Mytilus edulis]|uniref:Uncharacterized protein n=1 Tax=Mytilus edulis TaxID=6550 RepID=A0A8S3RG86_MYTED|nr:unnamed protein product [Mytilus edulis]